MSTVSSIAAAIARAIDSLSFVTYASATEFLPSATNANCAAFVVPFGQETSALPDSFNPDAMTLVHTLTVEFWVKHTQGKASDTMTTARDAGALAIAKLIDQDGTGYTLARGYEFTERVEQQFVTHMGVPWLISSLRVSVENEVST